MISDNENNIDNHDPARRRADLGELDRQRPGA